MLHEKRIWSVADVAATEQGIAELAYNLTQMTFCGCNGFRLGGYLLLNDSTGPDGAQEFAILERDTLQQVESVTFGWMKEQEAVEFLQELTNGIAELVKSAFRADPSQLQSPEEHGACYLCM